MAETPESEKGSEEKENVTLDEIVGAVKDGPGYVIFAGVLSKEKDDRGFNLINFHYRRRNFSYDDTKHSVREFKKALMNDINKDMDDGEST